MKFLLLQLPLPYDLPAQHNAVSYKSQPGKTWKTKQYCFTLRDNELRMNVSITIEIISTDVLSNYADGSKPYQNKLRHYTSSAFALLLSLDRKLRYNVKKTQNYDAFCVSARLSALHLTHNVSFLCTVATDFESISKMQKDYALCQAGNEAKETVHLNRIQPSPFSASAHTSYRT